MEKRNERNDRLESLSFGLVELESAQEVEEVVPSAFSHFPIRKIDYLIITHKKNNNDQYMSKPYIIDRMLSIIRCRDYMQVFSVPFDFRFNTVLLIITKLYHSDL